MFLSCLVENVFETNLTLYIHYTSKSFGMQWNTFLQKCLQLLCHCHNPNTLLAGPARRLFKKQSYSDLHKNINNLILRLMHQIAPLWLLHFTHQRVSQINTKKYKYIKQHHKSRTILFKYYKINYGSSHLDPFSKL